jgi:hypothetical protein
MKTKKNYPILALAALILCVSALGEVRLPFPEDNRPILIGRPNPNLAVIEQLYVVIVQPDAEPNKDGLVWKELDAKVKDKLEETAIKIASVDYVGRKVMRYDIPVLIVETDMLKLTDPQQYVFRIQTSLSRPVFLTLESSWHIKADVWKKGSPMQAVSVKSMPAKVTDVVLEQVEEFTQSWRAANPRSSRPSATNDITVKPEKLTKPDTKPIVAEHKYIASKNSKVFHKSDCRWVKRISAKNLISYSSKNEAIEAGKRPCKSCNP